MADFVAAIGKPANPALCAGKKYTFGYDTFSDTDEFAVALYKGLQSYAKTLGCVTINKLVDNANAGTVVQNAQIFAQQHVDGAILFNVVQAASQGQAQVLNAANIPVVALAVPVTGKPFITNDDQADGRRPVSRSARHTWQNTPLPPPTRSSAATTVRSRPRSA